MNRGYASNVEGVALARCLAAVGTNTLPHVAVTLVLPAVFWHKGAPSAFIAWMAAMLVAGLWRARLTRLGRLSRVPARLVVPVRRHLVAMAATVGALHMGFATWLIPGAAGLEQQVMLIAPCVALAAMALSARTCPRVAWGYAAAMSAVGLAWLVLNPQLNYLLTAFLCALFIASQLRMLAPWHAEEIDRIRTHERNRELARDLGAKRREASSMLRRLNDEIAERKRIEHQVEVSERRFTRLMDTVAVPMFVFREKFLHVNDAAAQTMGYEPQDIVGRPIWTFFHPDDAEAIRRNTRDRLEGYTGDRNYEARIVRSDGETRWLNINSGSTEFGGEPAGLGIAVDITEKKLAEIALETEREKAEMTLASIGDGVVTLDHAGNIELINDTARRMFVLEDDDTPGHVRELGRFVDEDTGLPWNPAGGTDHASRMTRSLVLQRVDGSELPVEVTVTALDEGAGGIVLALRDVREIRTLLEAMRYQATHDPLTELINRREFERRLSNVVENARTDHSIHGLLFMDLDKFKVVNDSCGHMAGDALLRAITARLSDLVRDGDTIARLGGDEFGILLEHCPRAKCERIAEELRESIVSFTFSWKGRVFKVGASIGLVMIDRFTESAQDALVAADNACYVAKEEGRNRVHAFTRADRAVFNKVTESDWVSRLQAALKDDALELAVQKTTPLRGETGLDYHELFLRLRDDDGELVPATRFLMAAERYGITVDLDRWVVRRAVTFINELPETSTAAGVDRLVAVNLSGLSLNNADFRDFAAAQVARLDRTRARLCFEITETSVVAKLDEARRFIDRMLDGGCSIAIDDFGAGMNSFRYLKMLPVDVLKIDRSFVAGVHEGERDAALLRSMVEVGRVLGAVTIAEGVEDDQALANARASGVDIAQGYAIARPVPLDESPLVRPAPRAPVLRTVTSHGAVD